MADSSPKAGGQRGWEGVGPRADPLPAGSWPAFAASRDLHNSEQPPEFSALECGELNRQTLQAP